MRQKVFSVVLIALLLSGCKALKPVTKPLGKSWDNFTAHYNTFYNAEQSYKAGVKAINEKDEIVDQDHYLPIFTSVSRTSSVKTFDNAVLKSADILRKHPKSKWTDDALLLIGKSYFYTQKFVGAEQKFNEVIDSGSELSDEARFWLARTFIASGSFELAEDHLKESLLNPDISKKWSPMLHLALGELYVKRKAWESASEEITLGLKGVHDDEVGAHAQFLLGQVYETEEQFLEAADAYARVEKFKPLYELAYAAKISEVRVLGMHGQPEKAIKKLRAMERDGKNFGYANDLLLMKGRLYAALGRPDDAVELLHELLYDPNNRNVAKIRGYIHYALGQIYRDSYSDYIYAAAYFDTASTALKGKTSTRTKSGLAGAAAKEAFTPMAITTSKEEADVFLSFAEVHDRIVEMDSLLYMGSLDDSTFDAIILQKRQDLAREREQQRREQERRRVEREFQNRGGSRSRGDTQDSGVEGKALPGKADDPSYPGQGFLSFKNPSQVQEGMMNFISLWGNRPLVPNWRRQAAVSGISEETLNDQDAASAFDPALLETALPKIDISAIPRDSTSRRLMEGERALARYQLGNVLFLSIHRPDSAAVLYRMVIEEDADQPVAQRAYYALAEVQQSLGDTLSARQLYQQVLEIDPLSELANRVRENLGLETVQAQVRDSLSLASNAYDLAYSAWDAGIYFEAMNRMVETAIKYPTTTVAPKALLASASVYMEWSRDSDLDLFGQIPLTIPDSTLIEAGILPVIEIPDSTAMDTGQPPMESAIDQKQDSLAVPVDSISVPKDTVLTDTTAVSPEISERSMIVIPDTLRLEMLYRFVENKYKKTPYAVAAKKSLTSLEAYRAELMTAPDSLGEADSLQIEVESPLADAGLDTTAVSSKTETPDKINEMAVDKTTANPEDDRLAGRPAKGNGKQPATSQEEMMRRMQAAMDVQRKSKPKPEVMPELLGGEQALWRKIKYPEAAAAKGITGKVLVHFTVDHRGRVKNAVVLKGLGYGCDEEALRVVNLAEYRPARGAGQAIEVDMTLAVPFETEE